MENAFMRMVLSALLWLTLLPVQAQPERNNWFFGFHAGLQFGTGGPAVTTVAPASESKEACAVASDSTGSLQCYSDGDQVWDRTNTPMPNGSIGNSYSVQSATQGALLIRRPGPMPIYYLFTVAPCEGNLAAGLRCSFIDMRLRNGLGDVVTGQKNLAVLPGQQMTEKLTAVRHRNGRDYWIIVHGWLNNTFYSFLLTPAGLVGTPVVSATGQVCQGGIGNGSTNLNATGYLRASPDGRQLAAASFDLGLELFAFDAATGRVSNPQLLATPLQLCYGAEFSPDNSKLYVSDSDNGLVQIDLRNGFAVEVLSQGPFTQASSLLRGPDGRMYVAELGLATLGVIMSPNRAGAACGLLRRAVPLGGVASSRFSKLGLPNFPTEGDARYVQLVGPVAQCAADTARFQASLSGEAARSIAWDFGDPATGSANAARGPAAAHYYAVPGTFVVRVLVTAADGRQYSASQLVTISYQPVLNLGIRIQGLCAGQPLVLGPATVVSGITYRWHDGVTTPTRTVTVPGRYRLDLLTPSGCNAHDSVTVVSAPAPVAGLTPDSVVCRTAFPLLVKPRPQPSGTRFQWPDGSTGPSWVCAAPGSYLLQMQSPLGCRATAAFRLQAADCPNQLPNIITPNGDAQNQAFVLKGLNAPDWTLRIYSRWGREIYQQNKYDNSWAAQGQAAGLYYYLLSNPATGQRHKGWLEVVR